MSDRKDLAVLAEYLAGLDASRLPAPVMSSAKACLLYGLYGTEMTDVRPCRHAG